MLVYICFLRFSNIENLYKAKYSIAKCITFHVYSKQKTERTNVTYTMIGANK